MPQILEQIVEVSLFVATHVVDHGSGSFLLVLLVITHLALFRRLAEWRSVHTRCFAEQFFLETWTYFYEPLVFLQSFS